MLEQKNIIVSIAGGLLSSYQKVLLKQTINDHHYFELVLDIETGELYDTHTLERSKDWVGEKVEINFGNKQFIGIVTQVSLKRSSGNYGCLIASGYSMTFLLESDLHCASWLNKTLADTDIICIVGKAMRGTLYDNGRNPNIVSAYSLRSSFTLATDVCKEKSNEIKSVPRLLDKLDVSGCVVTADAMSCQKGIIDKIRGKGGDFVIELKANQRSLRYGLEDSIKATTPTDIYKEGPYLEHGRIESRVCRIFRGEELIADREKWNGNLTVIEILTSTEKKSDGRSTSEQRLYISSLDSSAERLSQITKQHWAIESMHWDLDRNLRQDSIKRKAERAARNLDTIQRMVLALIAVWKNRRKKISDKQKGTAQIIRELAVSFTNVLHFLAQK